jgi:hypothetical protein
LDRKVFKDLPESQVQLDRRALRESKDRRVLLESPVQLVHRARRVNKDLLE